VIATRTSTPHVDVVHVAEQEALWYHKVPKRIIDWSNRDAKDYGAEDAAVAHPSYAQDREDEVAKLVVEAEFPVVPGVEDVVEGEDRMEKYVRKLRRPDSGAL